MQTSPQPATPYPAVPALRTIRCAETLTNSDQNDVLLFLEKRPLHTAYLAGLIRDNGIESDLNRGSFYGYRNVVGKLEGVALIGHAVLIETESGSALQAFAQVAQRCSAARLVMCEETEMDTFWGYYSETGREIGRACRHLLLELRWPIEVSQSVPQLRLATLDDLDLLVPVHAEMAHLESGVDPRMKDEGGFRSRYARRIEQGRTWVVAVENNLVFKAEVVSQTDETAYIEGVWVNPDVRGKGFGRRCMSQLAKSLLWRSKCVCLFVNDEDEQAQRFYRQLGYHVRSIYDTMFLK
jgi:predicted GNAT family acetyltransferase